VLIASLHGVRWLRDPYVFWHDDFQLHYLPASFEITTAWLHGEVPLLSRSSWFAGAFAAEYQYGIFSPLITACNVAVWQLGVSLPTAAACLAIVHLALVGAGAYLLGRSYRLTPALSVLVALVASSNGWLTAWGAAWYPSLSSFAWIPWFWLGLAALAAEVSPLRIVLCALRLYCLLTAGWPFTALMAALLIIGYLAPLLYGRRLRLAAGMITAVVLGVGLAAPAGLMLAEYISATDRQVAGSGLQHMWQVPIEGLLGLIVPTYTTTWTGFVTGPHAAIELAGGFVPLTGLLAAGCVLGRRFLPRYLRELALLATALLFMLLPSLGTFRWSFRWLPFFHLVLALLGALGIQALHAERARRSGRASVLNPGLWALLLLSGALSVASFRDARFPATLRLSLASLVLIAMWIVVARRGSRRILEPFPPVFAAFTVVSIFAFVPSDQSVPVWRFTDNVREPAPYRRELRYLALYRWDDVMGDDRRLAASATGHPLFRPGNVPMLAGLSFINGYSPLQPRGLRRLLGLRAHGHIDADYATRLLEKETRPGALLEHLGVDGLVLHQRLAEATGVNVDGLPGWRRAATIDGEILLERSGKATPVAQFISTVQTFPAEAQALSWVMGRTSDSLPFFRVDPETPAGIQTFCGAAQWEMVSLERLSAVVHVDTRECPDDSLLLLRRPWFPGYRAMSGERELPLIVADLVMPAVVVPARFDGPISIEYRPRTLWLGAIIALVCLLVVVGVATTAVLHGLTRHPRRRPRPASTF